MKQAVDTEEYIWGYEFRVERLQLKPSRYLPRYAHRDQTYDPYRGHEIISTYLIEREGWEEGVGGMRTK